MSRIPIKRKYKTIIVAVVLVLLVAWVFSHGNRDKTVSATTPSALTLQVPFSTQAPNNNWSRNEDCEETSITMANAFLTGTKENILPASEAEKSINNLKIWEQGNLGYNANSGVDATTNMAKGAFSLNVQQIRDFTFDDIKKALAADHPILLPINAQTLHNPNYSNGGPLYHMIVIRGYDDKGIIVNDPGTDTGNGNIYSFDVLKNAAADWNQTTKTMDPNRKFILVLSK